MKVHRRGSEQITSPRPCVSLHSLLEFWGDGSLATLRSPKVEGHPLSAASECLLLPFVSGGRLLHTQLQDAPVRGNKSLTQYGENIKITGSWNCCVQVQYNSLQLCDNCSLPASHIRQILTTVWGRNMMNTTFRYFALLPPSACRYTDI
jgi:hypothetical protein